MADIAMSMNKPSFGVVATDAKHHTFTKALAGENGIYAGAICFVDSNKRIYMCDGDSAATSVVHGWAIEDGNAGDPITLAHDLDVAYADGTLTPGRNYYVSGTKGRLSDTPTAAAPTPCAFAWDENILHIMTKLVP